jgi:hypothetical protein
LPETGFLVVESGSSDLDSAVDGVTVGSGLVGDWVEDVNSFWASEEFSIELNEIKTVWVLYWSFWLTFWVWLLDTYVWLIGIFWSFVGSVQSGWVNHSIDLDPNVWSNLLIGNILGLSESISPVWSWCLPSIVAEFFISSFPVKSFDFIVNEIVNVWFNSWLSNVLVKSLACWGVGPSVDWISGVSSSELWDWHHVFISSDESDDLLIDVGIANILGGSLVKSLACWGVRPSVDWISGVSSSELWDWHHVFISSDESNNFFIDVFIADIVLVSLGKSRPFSGLESVGGVWTSFFLSSLLKWVIDGVVGEVVDRVVIFWLSNSVLFLHKSSSSWGFGSGCWSNFGSWGFGSGGWGFDFSLNWLSSWSGISLSILGGV